MPQPGSVPWLLHHELRLLWRRYNLRAKNIGRAAAITLTAVAAQLIGFGAATLLQDSVAALADRIALANAVLLAVGALMLAYALDTAVAALFERRDLAWLLASPLPFRRLLGVRMLGVAVAVAAPWLLLLGPVANAMAALGQPGWLAVYPVLGALAVLATVAGTALAVWLVGAVGLRRARRVIGILGLAIGGLAFLAGQSVALLSPATQSALWRALAPPCCGAPPGLIWWPARALLGDPAPLLAALPLALAAAALAGWLLERRFATGAALDPPRPPAPMPTAGQRTDPGRFRHGTFGALLRKELRLLRRTPNLLSRAGYQLIYVLPAAAGLWTGDAAAVLALGAMVVFVAGETARLLIAAAANADQAAELTSTAPIRPSVVQAAKMAAAGLGAAAIVALPILVVAAWRPSLAPALITGTACIAASGLLVGAWRPTPHRRHDLGAPRQGFNANNLLGILLSGGWSAATWLAMAGSGWAALPAALSIAVLAVARPRRPPAMPP